MGFIGGSVGTYMLNAMAKWPVAPQLPDGEGVYAGRSKVEVLLGPGIWDEFRDKVVLDFGCGPGLEAVDIARHGAKRVIGLDLRDKWLRLAAERARQAGVADRCVFAKECHEPVDAILSLDSFEHFADPAAILETMRALLKPTGSVVVSFGPTWYHPLGGHVYSVFPFAHLVFSERALVRWRSGFKRDGARTIEESGLNKMTIARFEQLVARSPFRFASFEAVPIRKLRRIASRTTREFTTSIVRCRLIPA